MYTHTKLQEAGVTEATFDKSGQTLILKKACAKVLEYMVFLLFFR